MAISVLELQWSKLGGSDESTTACHRTNHVDLSTRCETDADQPAMDVVADADCSRQDVQPPQQVGRRSVKPAPLPVSAVRLSSSCVLLTYFEGDVASSVDEHFTRSLKAAATRHNNPQLADDGRVGTVLHQQLYRTTAAPKYRAINFHRTIIYTSRGPSCMVVVLSNGVYSVIVSALLYDYIHCTHLIISFLL